MSHLSPSPPLPSFGANVPSFGEGLLLCCPVSDRYRLLSSVQCQEKADEQKADVGVGGLAIFIDTQILGQQCSRSVQERAV